MLFICKKDKAVKNGLQPFWHSSFSFQSWKSHSGPKNTLSSSKLNCLHVKSIGALFKQIHICCGFCHFYSQAKSISAVASKTEAFSEGQQQLSSRCRQRSLSFCLLCSCLLHKGTFCSVEILHWHPSYCRLEWSPSHDCCGNTYFRWLRASKHPPHTVTISENPPY